MKLPSYKLSCLLFCIISFTGCQPGYQNEDGKWVWITYNEAVGKGKKYVQGQDSESFEVLSDKEYAKDRFSVYYKGSKIENADSPSFQLIRKGYTKDKNKVYLDRTPVIFADPQTFEILKWPYAKDKYRAYCGTVPLTLTEEEVEIFKVRSPKNEAKHSMVTSWFIQQYPEYQWLDSLDIKTVILGPGGQAEAGSRKFTGIKEVSD